MTIPAYQCPIPKTRMPAIPLLSRPVIHSPRRRFLLLSFSVLPEFYELVCFLGRPHVELQDPGLVPY